MPKSIFARAANILSANVNAMFDKWEDPAKMARQEIIRMKKDIATVKGEAAGVRAREAALGRKMDDYAAKALEAEHLAEAAEKAAIAATDEATQNRHINAAEVFLADRDKWELERSKLRPTYDDAKQAADMITDLHNKLVQDVITLESRIARIEATASTARAIETVTRATDRMGRAGTAGEAMGRFEDKATLALDKAKAGAALAAGTVSEAEKLKAEYSVMPSANTEDRLAQLRARIASKQ
jgi:phage shock protein A